MTEPTMMDLVGLWECGHCGQITDVTHFYMDRMTGQMGHEADPERREQLAWRCGWSSSYGGYENPPRRCALPHGHYGDHNPRLHGYGPFSEHDGHPPYDSAAANGSST